MGIIGGQDGPTVVFVTGSPMGAVLLLAAVVLVAAVIIRLFRHRNGR